MTTDPVQPDPATSGHDAFAAIAKEISDTGDRLLDAFRRAGEALAASAPRTQVELLPDEPPDRAVHAGSGPNAWVRDDASAAAHGEPISRWWMTGKRKAHTWEEALQHGADPGRRLVELPDPDEDDAVVEAIASQALRYLPVEAQKTMPWAFVRAVVRALAERGQP